MMHSATVTRRPMLWPCAHAYAEARHTGSYEAAPVELHVIRDAMVGGFGAHVRVDDAYIWGASNDLDFIRDFIERDQSTARWMHSQVATRPVERLFSVLNFHQEFGHFLLEILPKLYSIRRLNGCGIAAPIAWPTTAPAYMREIVKAVLPEQTFETFHPQYERLAAKFVLLPGSMGRNHHFHPVLAQDYQWHARNMKPAIEAERLFVSRLGLNQTSFRRLVNAEQLEDFARARGFTIIRPETMPHHIQVAAFAKAKVIMGEFGSGLHSAVFSPPGTKVVACNWVTSAQTMIGNLCGHDVGYQLPSDGRPRPVADASQMSEFEIDLGDLDQKLSSVLGIRPAR